MIRRDYLIVGAGIGGASVCEGIREHDKKGSIIMVGNEATLPYRRPTLLKSLVGEGASEPEPYLPHSWFEEEKIDLRLGTLISQLDLERRIAVLNTGQAVEFRKACLATGSRVRRLPVAGVNLGNIFHLRSTRDVLALKEVLEHENNLVVVGGGCIAAEAAAVFAARPRARVTLVHRGRNLWGRRLDEETGAISDPLRAGVTRI